MRKLYTIKVLDTTYTVYESNICDDPSLKDLNRDGYVNFLAKRIVVDEAANGGYKNHLINHELVHAFLFECGLVDQSWAGNEEIIDWMALQTPKLNKMLEKSKKMLKEKLR